MSLHLRCHLHLSSLRTIVERCAALPLHRGEGALGLAHSHTGPQQGLDSARAPLGPMHSMAPGRGWLCLSLSRFPSSALLSACLPPCSCLPARRRASLALGARPPHSSHPHHPYSLPSSFLFPVQCATPSPPTSPASPTPPANPPSSESPRGADSSHTMRV